MAKEGKLELEVEVSDNELVLIAAPLGEDVAARIAKVRLAVKLADVPWRLVADAIVGPDEVAVRHRVRLLLDLPQILGVARRRRR